jgi:hypothetical protein
VSDNRLERLWAAQQARWVCESCHDMEHDNCLQLNCECRCRVAVKAKRRSARGRDGLTVDQRRLQARFGFSDLPVAEAGLRPAATQGGRQLCSPCWSMRHELCRQDGCQCLCEGRRVKRKNALRRKAPIALDQLAPSEVLVRAGRGEPFVCVVGDHGVCRHCGLAIVWAVVVKTGRTIPLEPFNDDNRITSVHYVRCPRRPNLKRRNRKHV